MTQPPLTPYAPEWLATEQKLGGRTILKGPIPSQRAQFAALGAALAPLAPPLPDVLDIEDVMISATLRVRIYAPKEGKGSLPFGLYAHCGGFVMGGIEADDYFCRVIAMATPCVLVSVEYRLAPEHTYPAAHDDCHAAFEWAHANASAYGASPSKGFTIGQSAGANIALSLALRVRQSTHPARIKGVVAIGPPTVAPSAIPQEMKGRFRAEENADSAIIDGAAMQSYLDAYNPPPASPGYSVLLSPKLALLPPTYLVVCGKDPLRDDGLVFEQALRDAGVAVKRDYYEGWPHMFWIIPGLRRGEEAVGRIVEGVKWVVGKM